jgi:hypothetical protein
LPLAIDYHYFRCRRLRHFATPVFDAAIIDISSFAIRQLRHATFFFIIAISRRHFFLSLPLSLSFSPLRYYAFILRRFSPPMIYYDAFFIDYFRLRFHFAASAAAQRVIAIFAAIISRFARPASPGFRLIFMPPLLFASFRYFRFSLFRRLLRCFIFASYFGFSYGAADATDAKGFRISPLRCHCRH